MFKTRVGGMGFGIMIILIGVFNHMGWAQSSESSVTLEPIMVTAPPVRDIGTTGSRLGGEVNDIPANIEILDQETLRQRGNRTNIEAVEGAVGWSGAYSPGNGAVFSHRGFVGNDIAILHDGTRISNPTMSSRPLNTFQFSRIEVLNGPASVLHGEGAISGAINYISKQPNPEQFEHEGLFSYGSFDTLRLGLGSGGPLGDTALSYRVDGSLYRTDGYVDRSGIQSYNAAGALRYDIVNNLSLALRFEWMKDDIDSYFGTPLNNGEVDTRIRRRNYNVSDNLTESQSYWIRFDTTWAPLTWLEAQNQFYYYTADRDWRNAEGFQFFPEANEVLIRDLGDVRHDQDLVGNRAYVRLTKPILGRPNRFVAGFDISHNDFFRAANFFSGTRRVDAFNPDVGTFESNAPFPLRPGTKTVINTAALFFEEQLTLVKPLKLVGGLRVEWLRVDIDDRATGENIDNDFHPVTGRIGLVYNVLPNSTLYAHYVTGTNPPRPFVLGRALDFDLEKSREVEVGVKQSFWEGRLEMNLALYYLEKRDIVTRRPGNPNETEQIGKQRSHGLEFSFSAQPLPNWRLAGNMSVLDAEFREFNTAAGVSLKGNTPPNVPELLANVWTSYRLFDALELGGSFRYVGEREGDNANQFQLPSYFALGLYGRYTYKQWQFTVRGRNITDELIVSWAETDFGEQVQIENPASVEVSVSAKF